MFRTTPNTQSTDPASLPFEDIAQHEPTTDTMSTSFEALADIGLPDRTIREILGHTHDRGYQE